MGKVPPGGRDLIDVEERATDREKLIVAVNFAEKQSLQ